MNDFDIALSKFKDELFNEQCVKEYFYYKNLVDKDESIKKLDEEARFHQKEMCKNKDNNEVYFKEKALYEETKNKLDNNPILINYKIAKEEVFSLLVDIKHILG